MKQATKSFQDLIVWQKAHYFVVDIYKSSKCLPKEEVFGLTSQLRRASVSIPANIAEGFARKSKLEKLRFYNISQGSLEEVRYYLILIKDLEYWNTTQQLEKIDEISRLLSSFMKTIKKSIN